MLTQGGAHLTTATLVRVPPVQPMESPASWVARLAYMQLVDPAEIMLFLGMRRTTDPDLAFTWRVAQNASRVCGLEFGDFAFMRHMLKSLSSLGVPPQPFLLSVDSVARYRFCKQCLREQRVKHYPLHWRFKAWRWCPEHHCLLKDRCPHCHALVTMPASLFRATAHRRSRGLLDQCMVCNGTLWAKSRQRRFDAMKNFLSPWERHLLGNGRAALAALWRRSMTLCQGNVCQVRPLRELVRLERAGLLPHGQLHHERDEKIPKRYRHPLSHHVVDLGRAKSAVWRGLFDG
jgi:hypothetical protein